MLPCKKNITYWLEIVENLSKEYRAAMGLRNGSRAYFEDDRVIVKVNNNFTVQMMSEDNVKASLSAMISSQEGRMISPENIFFEVKSEEDKNTDDLFDTLI